MLEDVTKWLAFYGYAVTQEDEWALEFIISGAEQCVKDQINRPEIPVGLRSMAVDMAAGEFLRRKKTTGSLEGFDLEAAFVSSVKEGDTTVSYDGGAMTDEQRLDALIAQLTSVSRSQLARYRRLAW